MKKSFLRMIAVALVFHLACISAWAAETAAPSGTSVFYTKEQITSKALTAFPEYQEEILGENLATAYSRLASVQPTVVFSETRAISQDERVHLTTYSNGVSLLAVVTSAGKNTVSTGADGNFTTEQLNAWLTCVGSDDVLMIYDFSCRYSATNNANFIVNSGRISELTTTVSATRGTTVTSGTQSSPAYVQYMATFEIEIPYPSTGQTTPVFQTGVLEINGLGNVRAL